MKNKMVFLLVFFALFATSNLLCMKKCYLASAGLDKKIKFWEINRDGELSLLQTIGDDQDGTTTRIRALCFSPCGRFLAVGFDKTIKIWKKEYNRLKSIQTIHENQNESTDNRNYVRFFFSLFMRARKKERGALRSLCYSPCGGYLTGGFEKAIVLWESKNGVTGVMQIIRQDEIGDELGCFVEDLSFCGRYLVSISSRGVMLWKNIYGKLRHLHTIARESSVLCSSVLCWKGFMVLSYSWKIISYRNENERLIKLESDNEIHHQDCYISSLCFGPHGKHLFSGSWDYTIKLWKNERGKFQHLQTFPQSSSVEELSLSPCGKYLIAGFGDQTMKLWEKNDDELIEKQTIDEDQGGHRGELEGGFHVCFCPGLIIFKLQKNVNKKRVRKKNIDCVVKTES